MKDTTDRTVAEPTAEDTARKAMMALTERLGMSWERAAEHLAVVLKDMRSFANRGANNRECHHYVGALIAELHALFPAARTSERDEARAELEADTREDHANGMLAIEGRTPATLDHHADTLMEQGVSSFTLMYRRREEARAIRSDRATARQRVGVA